MGGKCTSMAPLRLSEVSASLDLKHKDPRALTALNLAHHILFIIVFKHIFIDIIYLFW